MECTSSGLFPGTQVLIVGMLFSMGFQSELRELILGADPKSDDESHSVRVIVPP
jgi:hypothetical protein